jgi:hypothetical protein
MVTDDDPLLNVSAVSVAVSIALFAAPTPVDTAMCAELIVVEPVEYLLEKCTRILLPPKVACTTWRNVLLAKYGEAGLFPVSVNCWPVAQVPIHVSVADAVCQAQEILSIKKTNPAALVFFNILILSSSFQFSRNTFKFLHSCYQIVFNGTPKPLVY